ncbi:hypothetical protein [Palleronia abyssalis]|uniref:Arginine transporter n=1 Tax=Palleronia abyssalis TaxID=1501240 RepID=A0A2R8BXN8_9RHOB|nr:hypothetical protein [Palleronia abyssalis]SPJ24882.1 hypothetical protein PAA8504_02723 [Palleronia abyssalis]
MKSLILTAAAGLFLATSAHAGVIESACNRSDRAAGKRQLCNCIQQVADFTLDRRDQRLAARFFKDPHKAQEIRQSSRANDEVFWKRYREFGSAAESYCS